MRYLLKKILLILSYPVYGLLRLSYIFIKKRFFPNFPGAYALQEANSSKMLAQFNPLHRLLFGRLVRKTQINPKVIDKIKEAQKKGPVIYLLNHPGFIEFQYFNQLFLRENIDLADYSNANNMATWMTWSSWRRFISIKLDHLLSQGRWLKNKELVKIEKILEKKQDLLLALNLSPEPNIDATFEAINNLDIFKEISHYQKSHPDNIQLIPLHFLFNRHPDKNKKRPGLFKKLFFYLASIGKSAAANIGDPIDLKSWISQPEALSKKIHQVFFQESRSITGPKIKKRAHLIQEILASSAFEQDLNNLAQDYELNFLELKKKSAKLLEEIAGDMRPGMIQFWDKSLKWVFKHIYSGLIVDEESIEKIRACLKKSPIVLVPSHRSHMDYLMLSYVFYNYNLSLPYICAGKNLNIWPIGQLFRRSGAYFIRRSFDSDVVYPLALQHYLRALLKEGAVQEFFIEGTRSRSGKSSAPKLGLLEILIENFKSLELEDLYFVPVAINYERTLEGQSYISEIQGKHKKSERGRDLLRLPKILRKRYGKVHVQFGEALSLRKYLDQNSQKTEEKICHQLGDTIIRSINNATTILPSSIIAMALLSDPKKSILHQECLDKAELILKLCQENKSRFSGSLSKYPRRALERALKQFEEELIIKSHYDGSEKFYTIRGQARLKLDYYKNLNLHCIYSEALLCYILSNNSHSNEEKIKSAYQQFANLFKQEFFLKNFDLCFMKVKQLLANNKDNIKTRTQIASLCYNFLESYFLVLEYISKQLSHSIDRKELEQKIAEQGQIYLLREKIKYKESLSKINIQNCIKALLKLDILNYCDHPSGHLKINSNKKELLKNYLYSVSGLGQANPVIIPESSQTRPFKIM